MCMCCSDEEVCSNVSQELLGIDDDDDDDDDPDYETLIVTFLVPNWERWWLEDVEQRILT